MIAGPCHELLALIANVCPWSVPQDQHTLVRNQGLEVDDDMELAPGNVPLDETHV